MTQDNGKAIPSLIHEDQTQDMSSLGKEIREWSSMGVALLALGISTAGYMNSKGSSQLDLKRFNAARALVLVADKDKDLRSNGVLFRFHPLQANQHISKITITVPSDLSDESWNAEAPDQVLSLTPIEDSFQKLLLNQKEVRAFGPVIVYTQIPVVLDSLYSVDGETMRTRGLYTIPVRAEIFDRPLALPSVQYQDFIFQGPGDPQSNRQQIVDEAWKEEKESLPHNTQRVITLHP